MDNNQITGFSVKDLKVEESDGKDVTLLEGFVYTTLSGVIIAVPAGACSDGASTPQLIWNLIPPSGDYWMAAFLHDYLYRSTRFERLFCDNTLLEAMKRLNVNRIKAYIIYWGVRLGGWHAFSEDRK